MQNLGNTNDLMRVLNIGSQNTINKLQTEGVIKPIWVGKRRKWDLQECLKSIKQLNDEKVEV